MPKSFLWRCIWSNLAVLLLLLGGAGCGDDGSSSPPDASVADASAPDATAADAAAPDAMAVTVPYLLVGNTSSDNVLRFEQTGAFIDELIPAGTGGLDSPDLLLVRGDQLYISSGTTPANSGIIRFDLDTGAFVDVFAQGGGLHRPYGFAFGPDGYLYVSSFLTDQILRYDANTGAFVDEFAAGDAQPGGLNGPNGMIFGEDGLLYVSTQGSVAVNGEATFPGLPSQVLRYDPADGSSEVFIDQPTPLADSAGFVSLLGVVFGPDCGSGACDLFVSDFANGIRRYDDNGALLDDISTSYTGATTSNFTGSLSFGASGDLFSVGFDSTNGSDNAGVILRWDGATGDPLPAAGLSGALLVDSDGAGLFRPIGILAITP
ncbi:PEP-CTERM sorting domain-containing protein [Haliangium sp.]|uniref:Vgb family protein n=1 Tax=Haliangium sp. TaxID=2663208 RepID=UPI003D0CA51F